MPTNTYSCHSSIVHSHHLHGITEPQCRVCGHVYRHSDTHRHSVQYVCIVGGGEEWYLSQTECRLDNVASHFHLLLLWLPLARSSSPLSPLSLPLTPSSYAPPPPPTQVCVESISIQDLLHIMCTCIHLYNDWSCSQLLVRSCSAWTCQLLLHQVTLYNKATMQLAHTTFHLHGCRTLSVCAVCPSIFAHVYCMLWQLWPCMRCHMDLTQTVVLCRCAYGVQFAGLMSKLCLPNCTYITITTATIHR